MSMAVVITTIQPPTAGVRAIASHAATSGQDLIVVGDRKSPAAWDCDGVDYWPIDRQATHASATATRLPTDSYARKMLGYLVAAGRGHTWIRETDDDNRPYDAFFEPVPAQMHARRAESADRWVNIYSFFTDRFVWPRGFPLSRLRTARKDPSPELVEVAGPYVLQAVADGDPDVDAVYRLTTPDASDIRFSQAPPLMLSSGLWTPFNSQATTWPVSLLPLMYLPTTCSFRMTDIWRSFIAQRIMAALGIPLVITGPSVFQERNAHDLMRDFRDEVEGYVGYDHFVDMLENIPVTGTRHAMLEDLRRIYGEAIHRGFFSDAELPVLDAWLTDMRALGFAG